MYARPSSYRRDVAELIRAPSRQPLSQSVKELLYVDQNGSMVPYDSTLTPYMNEPMDCLKSRQYDSVVYAGPARTGKSVTLVEGFLVDTIARDRADCLLVHISQDRAGEFSKRNLSRAVQASAECREALSPHKYDNSIHLIKLRSGAFTRIGWPSKNVFASQSYRRVLLTDLDRMDLDVDGEGSPFLLASKRTQTYGSSGMVMAESSPGFPVTDPAYRPEHPHEAPPTLGILSLYNLGDRRMLYWPCPDCGEWFRASVDYLLYDKNEPDPNKASKDVMVGCPHCGSCFREDQQVGGEAFKLRSNNRAIWVPQGCHLDQNGVMHGERRATRIASFWQQGTSAAFQNWDNLVWKLTAARKVHADTGDSHELQTVTNVDFGLPFAPPRLSETSADALAARRKDMGVKVVPAWCRALIATIDVQGGKGRHFVVQVHGVGVGLETAIVDRYKIEKSKRKDPENPDKFQRVKPGVYAEDWDLITEKVIGRAYEIDDGTGRHLSIYRTACDSAGEDGVTAQAYDYYRRLKKQGLHRRFILVKGGSTHTAPLVEMKMPDNSGRSNRKAKTHGEIPILFINSNRMKDIVSASLGRDVPGARYIHYPDWLGDSFFSELVAEERSILGKWEKVSTRNEAFDLLVYLWAVLHHLKAERVLDWDSPPLWLQNLDINPEVMAVEGSEVVRSLPKRRRRASS